jgi:hypothetical protein
MSLQPIDSTESFFIDQNGKVKSAIQQDVTPDIDEKGAYITTKKGKRYVYDLVKKIHGKAEADAYREKFEAYQDAIFKANSEGPKETQPEVLKEVPPEEKIAAVAEYFEENNGATYDKVKEALLEEGVKVNDQHVSKGKEAAGLK